jgi:hypothetical protein
VFTRIKLLTLSIFISVISYGQVLTSTFVDPCSKKVTIFVIPLQGGTTLTFMGKSKFFTALDVRSGAFSTWINQVYAEFSAPCPVSVLANQVTTTTVSATIAASIPSVSNIAPTPPPPAPASAPASQSSSSSSEQNSTSSESSSSEQKTESTEESKSDSKEESKEEKKEENKKEDKKKNGNKSAMTPIIFSSDLSGVHQFQGEFNLMANIGVSQSSLAGDVSYGATAIIFSNLKQFAFF